MNLFCLWTPFSLSNNEVAVKCSMLQYYPVLKDGRLFRFIENVPVFLWLCTSNLIKKETFTERTQTHTHCLHGNRAATLLFNSGWVNWGRWLLCPCVFGRSGGWFKSSRGCMRVHMWRGSNIKQHIRHESKNILKSNHNLVISRKWYDQNKEGDVWEDRETTGCTCECKGEVR